LYRASALPDPCIDTMDFQALPFYERHGYSVFGVLDDMPRGHQRFFLKKALA